MDKPQFWLATDGSALWMMEHEGDYGDNDIVISVTPEPDGVTFGVAEQDKQPIKVTIKTRGEFVKPEDEGF